MISLIQSISNLLLINFRYLVIGISFLATLLSPLVSVSQDIAPHFVSLRYDEARMRVGPGSQYPILWVFVRAGLPVEVIGKFNNWRKIRDGDGDEGWMDQRLLSPVRTVLVTGDMRDLWKSPKVEKNPVAHVKPGVTALLLGCEKNWCELELTEYRGWMNRKYLWGIYPEERFE